MTGAAPTSVLPPDIRARIVADVNGLDMHVLEAGQHGNPAILLLHGFPELAFSWRKVMPALAAAGFHVVAPDARGYGRTSGAPTAYDDDLAPFGILNLVRDYVALLAAMGLSGCAAMVGHDYGASVAAACALVRPDLFRSLVIMSAPFTGPPSWPLPVAPARDKIHDALAALDPPRKHYHAYFATRAANDDMCGCTQGLGVQGLGVQGIGVFLRDYFHMKSADWFGNRPFDLRSWSAAELAQMPRYYIMPLELDMPATVAAARPSTAGVATCHWLRDEELGFYASEYARTGFQGGLQWYRGRMDGSLARDLALFAGRTIDCPALFMAGAADWGAYQIPGGLERMRRTVFKDLRDVAFIENAGHWVQQEQPDAVVSRLLAFLRAVTAGASL